jgi:curved DNA-binding protein CbpA
LTPPWPTSPRTSPPTPYEIFHLPPTAPYSKRRFYELVKIYHPDRHLRAPAAEHPIVASRLNPGAGVECLSRAVKLERYRLVVAANDILSDPAKRAAYDRYGAGWAERLELTGGSGRRGAKGHGWDPWDGRSAARNATWEDWERWREQGGVDGGRAKQEPVYVSNGAFVVLLLLVAMVGVAAEIRRADGLSRSFLEQVKAANDERSRELGRKRMGEGVEGTWSREERVGHFLRSREDAVSTYLDGDRKLVPRPAGRIEHEWEK